VHAWYITRKWMCSESRDLFIFWEISDYLVNGARHSCNGKLIGNRIWPIVCHQCQCPWMTFVDLNLYNCHSSWNIELTNIERRAVPLRLLSFLLDLEWPVFQFFSYRSTAKTCAQWKFNVVLQRPTDLQSSRRIPWWSRASPWRHAPASGEVRAVSGLRRCRPGCRGSSRRARPAPRPTSPRPVDARVE